MNSGDRKRFVDMLQAVYAMQRVDLSDAVTELWWAALEEYELPAVLDAFKRHTKNPDTGQFLPKPADVVRQLEGSTQDVALLAWARVVQAVRDHGTYVSVDFADPLIHRVLTDLGGWVWLGQQQESEMPFIEKRFRDAYRAWRARPALLTEAPLRLPGIVERDNAASGYAGAFVIKTLPGGATLVERAPALKAPERQPV